MSERKPRINYRRIKYLVLNRAEHTDEQGNNYQRTDEIAKEAFYGPMGTKIPQALADWSAVYAAANTSKTFEDFLNKLVQNPEEANNLTAFLATVPEFCLQRRKRRRQRKNLSAYPGVEVHYPAPRRDQTYFQQIKQDLAEVQRMLYALLNAPSSQDRVEKILDELENIMHGGVQPE